MPESPVPRRSSVQVRVGGTRIGGAAPILVQSMTDTPTADIPASVAQIQALAVAGSELVRLTVDTEAAAAAVPRIRDALDARGCLVPLIGDFHFNGHRLLTQEPACAQALAKYRINPGNLGSGEKRDGQFATLIEVACARDRPVRIGVNWGSLDQDLVGRLMDDNARDPSPRSAREVMIQAMVESALGSAARAEALGLPRDRIVLSCKMSGVQDLIRVYRDLAVRCDHALHLGLTEAGLGTKGVVASTAALAVLLQEGIGDTIRVSLTPEPGGDRTREVLVAQEILQTLGLRAFAPSVTACPGCGRTSGGRFQALAQEIQTFLRDRMPQWRQTCPGVEQMSVAVMGCVVNGPGESQHADIGISLPGNGERPAAPVFLDGEKRLTLKGEGLADDFKAILEDYVHRRYGRGTPDG